MENRETFFARLSPFMPPSELRNVEIAYMMAKYGHRAQKRKEVNEKGEQVRYFEHVRRVAIILIDESDVRDWRLIVAALLHDALEDTKDVNEGIIEHLFGARVCQIVKLLSKCPKEGYFDRLRKFGDEDVALIKGCDRLDNLRSIEQASEEFVLKQLDETWGKIIPWLAQYKTPKVAAIMQAIHLRGRELEDKYDR